MKVLMIAWTAIKQVGRDRTAFFFLVLFPFFIILMVGTATGQFDEDRFPVGVVDTDSGPLGEKLTAALRAQKLLNVEAYPDAEDLRRDVRRGAVIGGVVIPPGYDREVRSGSDVRVTFLADPGRGFPAVIRAAVAAAVSDQGARLQAANFATDEGKDDFDANLRQAERTEELIAPVEVSTDVIGRSPRRQFSLTGFGYQAPSNFVLFVFITSLAAAAQLIEARRLGVTRRMLGTPTSAGTILAGQMLGRLALALFQGLYIIALGIVVFSVDFGDPLGAAAIVIMFVLVSTSFAMLAGTVLRTPEQLSATAPPVGIAMGMLAGCMWPRFIMPEPMQRIGQLFPHAWAMDAWIKLIGFGGGVGSITRELAVLAGFVVVILPIATWRLRRSIVAG